MKKRRKKYFISSLFLLVTLFLVGCGNVKEETMDVNVSSEGEENGRLEESRSEKNVQEDRLFSDLSFTDACNVTYAQCFSLQACEDYELISMVNGDHYLLIPKGGKVPMDIPEGITVLQKPLDHTYLVSSSVFDLLQTLEVMDRVTLSGTKEEDLHIEGAVEALQQGRMTYAGKYSMPDYELLLQKNCNLAIENTMIYHTPETKEQLERIGIPVLVEQSSHEAHPLGRMEWIKVYGMLFDREKEAEALFDEQVEKMLPIMQKEKTGQTVAFFYVNANGIINVRKPGDYISRMIELSGGEYAFSGEVEENALSTMNMQMEDFFMSAGEADIIIYNSTVSGKLESVDELLAMNPLFAQFKAVKDKKVYTTDRNFFQSTWGLGEFMQDLDKVFRGEDENEFFYLEKVN